MLCDNVTIEYTLMNRIREVLLTEYIGAILVAVLISEAFVRVITLVTARVYYALVLARYLPENSHEPPFSVSILMTITESALFLASAYLLARWLYGARHGVGPDSFELPGESEKSHDAS